MARTDLNYGNKFVSRSVSSVPFCRRVSLAWSATPLNPEANGNVNSLLLIVKFWLSGHRLLGHFPSFTDAGFLEFF